MAGHHSPRCVRNSLAVEPGAQMGSRFRLAAAPGPRRKTGSGEPHRAIPDESARFRGRSRGMGILCRRAADRTLAHQALSLPAVLPNAPAACRGLSGAGVPLGRADSVQLLDLTGRRGDGGTHDCRHLRGGHRAAGSRWRRQSGRGENRVAAILSRRADSRNGDRRAAGVAGSQARTVCLRDLEPIGRRASLHHRFRMERQGSAYPLRH